MEAAEVNTTERGDTEVPEPKYFDIAIYSMLFVAGAVGNTTTFTSLLRARRKKSRVNLLMIHLTVADMMITFIVIPLEIAWRTSNGWITSSLACKVFLVLRAFGQYLSSNLLVCISLDRYFAILYPLRSAFLWKRSKQMLIYAWTLAFLFSIPQCFVFRVNHHSHVPDYQQCVSFEAFTKRRYEIVYNVFHLCAVYFLPLLIIFVCYVCIFLEVSKKSKEIHFEECDVNWNNNRVVLRRSDDRPLSRARWRTLMMTITIVSVFAICWLPYVVMTLWYMIDKKSTAHVSASIQNLFFVMAAANSCMDPLVYGSYRCKTITDLFFKSSNETASPGPEQRTTTPQVQRVTVCVHDHPSLGRRTSNASSGANNTHSRLMIRPSFSRWRPVHFEETLTSPPCPSVHSDPIPSFGERSFTERTVRPSQSWEMFSLHTPHRTMRL